MTTNALPYSCIHGCGTSVKQANTWCGLCTKPEADNMNISCATQGCGHRKGLHTDTRYDPKMACLEKLCDCKEFRDPRLIAWATRDEICDTAKGLITGDRNSSYGDAGESFGRLAALWAPILGMTPTREQVALCLVQLKVSRLVASPTHADSWVDIVGYAALGGEIAAKGQANGQ